MFRFTIKILLLICIVASFSLVGLVSCKAQKSAGKGAQGTFDENPEFSILFGLVVGIGGLGDRAYNDMLYNGMINSKLKYGLDFIYAEPEDEEASEKALEELILKGAKCILAGGGWLHVDPVDELARKYPDVYFVILDDFANEYLPNVASVLCKQNEGSFLAGALAALHSKTNAIGMVGGVDQPVIHDFWVGYEAGAKAVKPNIKVHIDYVEKYDPETNPFENSPVGRIVADNMFRNQNVDIIYQVAGGSGIGVFNAAKDNERYAIGVDIDQDHLVPGVILTSMIKKFDIGIEFIVDSILA
ncbi:MAG: BMP family ABC transporter substrate-binding protein, partial [Candidatus Cloacimonetes bacterium]|nr:BMP family ABC transporter substrate-binding protein [Candidatus Cloacimonadota bacterium]